MVYKHHYFSLDTQKREVYDENKKLLRMIGTRYTEHRNKVVI